MTTRTYRPTPRNLAHLARLLAEGQLVATPTETVYGLAADALNPRACRAIFRAKRRPANDPLIVHVDTLEQAAALAHLNDAARQVAAAHWPGPLTLILPKRDIVPAIVTSGLDSVAIRMPAHPLMRQLVRLSKRPLAAPSANPFGYVSPTTAAHVFDNLRGKILAILDGGPCKIGLESSILDLRDPRRPVLLRPGAVSKEALEKTLKRSIKIHQRPNTPRQAAAVAPGLLARHYSPKTPLLLLKKITPRQAAAAKSDTALLFFQKPDKLPSAKNHFYLSKTGDSTEAAQNLFSLLRKLDAGKYTQIIAELAPPQTALAPAINDRLTRAAAKR